MKTIGIICEYNPFHNGHARQLRLIRERFGEDAAIVCLMSGNYVQRGEPAIFEKSVRARAAVECGADLVLELPFTYALRSAEGFADGGVEILDALGVEVLCFGCECGDPALLTSTAETLLTPEFQARLKEKLASGVSFPAARSMALAELTHAGASALEAPNDILAVEYCKAIRRRGSAIEPYVLRRDGAYYGTEDCAQSPSASYLRERITAGEAWIDSVPRAAAAIFQTVPRYTMAAGERAVLARVRTLPDEAFEALPYGSEGLWRKLMHACRTEASVEDILTAVKSKRYTRTRVQRMLICAYLGLSGADLNAPTRTVRILAFRRSGQILIKQMRNDGEIQLLNSGQKNQISYLEERATDLFTLFSVDKVYPCGLENARRNILLP